MNSSNILKLFQEQFSSFANTKYPAAIFCICIYGSFIDKEQTKDSDLDFLLFNNNSLAFDINDLKEFTTRFHHKNSLKVDIEIPYENKLIVTTDEIERIVNLNGLDLMDNKFRIPNIIPSPEYMSSKKVKARLIFNALTRPNYIFGNNPYLLSEYLTIAEYNLCLLAIDILDTSTFTKNEIMEILFTDGIRHEGGYLGYKRRIAVLNHIDKLLDKQISKLCINSTLKIIGDNKYQLVNCFEIDTLKSKFSYYDSE